MNDKKRLVRIEKPDKVLVNEKFLVKIYFKDEDYKIKKAYFDCEENRKISKDSIVVGCSKLLKVEHDTIRIAFIPTKVGEFTFEKITILSEDIQNEELRLLDTTFSYKVFDYVKSD